MLIGVHLSTPEVMGRAEGLNILQRDVGGPGLGMTGAPATFTRETGLTRHPVGASVVLVRPGKPRMSKTAGRIAEWCNGNTPGS